MVKINTLTLSPFKGIENLKVDFQNKTEISGENGTGKTTIADAWFWLITGKSFAGLTDSGKAAFSVIPRDGDTAQVTAEITADGEKITLKRYIEVKAKSKKTKFFIDETEVQKAAFDDFVQTKLKKTDVRPYCVPGAFMELDTKEQRAMLLETVATHITAPLDGNEQAVADEIKKIGDLAIWERGKKTAIKDGKAAILALTESIKTAESLRPIPQDYTAIEKELADLTTATAATENGHYQELLQKKEKIIRDYTDAKSAALNKITIANADYQELLSKQKYAAQVNAAQTTAAKSTIENYNKQILRFKNDLADLRKMFVVQRDKQRTPSDTSCVKCPICEQINCDNPLILANLEESEKQAAAAFTERKNKALDEINAKGREIKQEIEKIENQIKIVNADLEKEFVLPFQKEIADAKARLEKAQAAVPTEPDTTAIDAEIEKIKAAESTIAAAEKERAEKIKQLSSILAEKETAAKIDAKIKEIERQREEVQENLGENERKLALSKEIRRKQMLTLESNINGQFSENIKFKLFEEQVNGDFADACQLYVNGIPYGRGANRAAEINAGLLICQFLQKGAKVSLPVFVDNTESVNDLVEIEPQTITLKVSKDKEMIIINK